MQRKRPTFRAMRQRLLARASALAMQVALRPRGWASGLLAVGLIGADAPALAQEVIDLATDADVIIQGAVRSNQVGLRASGAGDVNGDRIPDLVFGDPVLDPNGRNVAGASFIVFGTGRGFPATIDLATDADVIIQGAAAGDWFGHSVSGARDIDSDGIDDLIIGAKFADANGRINAGAAYVVFGTNVGFPPTIDLATDADLVIQGAAARDGTGDSVSAGDVDGDGIDDVIIGASYADPNGRYDAGASYVVFGTDQGFPATIDLASDADVIIQGAAALDRSGRSVSGAGDVDGDGIDDLIIGAPGAGASYVIFGNDLGLPRIIDLAIDAELIIQAAGDGAGRSVSGAGDVDGDGIDDLIIGAPYADPNGRHFAGASYVVFGSDQGLPPTIDLPSDADLVIQGAFAIDFSGVSVSIAGDVDGDGIDDLIIGAPYADPNGRDRAGASYVVFGTDQGFPPTIDLATDADVIIQGAAALDHSGSKVSGAGDINGDGADDLIVGARRVSPEGLAIANASYVVFGGPEAAIERLIARVEAAELSGGIENSLVRKLDSALGLLARGNTTGAIGKLGDFIDQVEAQRGKQIDEADADAWIAAAETILDMLSTS